MLKIIDAAILSDHIYNPSKQSLHGLKIYVRNKTATRHNGWARMTDVDSRMNSNNPFYAQLYLKFEAGKATDGVVVYRGTDKRDNYFVDAETWYKNVLYNNEAVDNLPNHHYTVQAIEFFRTSMSYTRRHFPELQWGQLKTAGHSLGGALAAILPLACSFPTRAITFNAPGIGSVPGVNLDMGGNLYNVEARYDFVSKIGKTIGKIYLIDVPEEASTAKAAFEHHNEAEKLEADIDRHPYSFETPYKMMEVKDTIELSAIDCAISALAQHKISHLVAALQKKAFNQLANMIVV